MRPNATRYAVTLAEKKTFKNDNFFQKKPFEFESSKKKSFKIEYFFFERPYVSDKFLGGNDALQTCSPASNSTAAKAFLQPAAVLQHLQR